MGQDVTDVGLPKKAVEHELRKHVATIHCSNSLSLLQRKISNALLFHAHKELLLKEEHEISIKQLCKLIAYQGNNHAAIKDALKELLSTVIEWNVVNDTTAAEDWTASSILASVSLQGPLCYYAYSPRMKQLLHSPSMFGKINLLIQARFKSSYGLALYENCVRYCGLPHTKWFDMEMFRKLMGVPPDVYPVFRDFKRRVLDKSVEEVNTYSDLFVEPDVHREGRRVLKIRFLLKERNKKTRIGVQSSESTDTIIAKLLAQYALTREQSEQLLQAYGAEAIQEKMALIEASKNYQQGKVSNLAGYLFSALKNNYQAAKASADHVKEMAQQHRAEEMRLLQLKKMVEKAKQAYCDYRATIIDAAIQAMSAADRHAFLETFHQEFAAVIQPILQLQRRKYTRETVVQSPVVKAQLRQFALQALAFLHQEIMPMQDFIDTLPEEMRFAWQQFQESFTESHVVD